MIHKFKRWKNRRKYDEAYLEIERDRVIETEKLKRQEIGEEVKEKPEDLIVQKQEIDGLPRVREKEEGGDEFSEDDRIVERPKSKLAFIRPLFWFALLGTTLYYFVPYMDDLLGQDLETYEPTVVESIDRADDEIDIGILDSPESETEDTASPQIGLVEDLERSLSESKKNFSTEVDLTDRKVNVYASVHSEIVRHTQELRDVIQSYISRSAQHVQMASKGGRIGIELNRLKSQLNQVEDDEIKTLLLRRIDRLITISLDATHFTRETALEEMNSFIVSENAESQTFINMFTQLLEEEKINYELRDGNIFFNKF